MTKHSALDANVKGVVKVVLMSEWNEDMEISLADTPDLDLAFRVFNKYEATGEALSEIVQALNIFNKILEKNFPADADLLEVLVNGLCSRERVDDSYTFVIEMVEKKREKKKYMKGKKGGSREEKVERTGEEETQQEEVVEIGQAVPNCS
ncbi:hypothetical protein IFM89_034573 [Coptis chinensis]|uniref:Uncharacterized protein n=1 Tax=Coptis chinensis TaxID=261450 RepID=A0A835HPE9_9MAGN|nr:hypothetical protein IFM89_034573 [Coptis chinensis]